MSSLLDAALVRLMALVLGQSNLSCQEIAVVEMGSIRVVKMRVRITLCGLRASRFISSAWAISESSSVKCIREACP